MGGGENQVKEDRAEIIQSVAVSLLLVVLTIIRFIFDF